MPPVTSIPKRRALPAHENDSNANKKARIETSEDLHSPHQYAKESEKYGIVLRKFYPPEMNNQRALAYNTGQLARPIELIDIALRTTAEIRQQISADKAVVHWFKNDLRINDNRALALASGRAQAEGISLICMYIVSPQDFEAHLTAPIRVDFILRCLQILKEDLAKLNIPLYIETVEKRQKVPKRIAELLKEWNVKHLFANMEYEVDELRREARMVRDLSKDGVNFEVVHDTAVVPPGELVSMDGKQYSVYSPWYRAWISHLNSNPDLLELFPSPVKAPDVTRLLYADLFASQVPSAPENKRLTDEEKQRYRSVWPAGEAEAQARLKKFVAERIHSYKEERNFPGINVTSSLSVHFATGTLSTRTAVRTARENNITRRLDGGDLGISTWISEIAWRDFYKHVLAHWPYISMNKPFKPEYSNIRWEYPEGTKSYRAWCEGRTGFPIVDAAMRQLNHIGWMHNRCRMIVASFLAKDLLIDWRMGEQYFMLKLIDGDLASNAGGWGFSSSTGVDPQPYFRIFNPILQSEKFDVDGEYIRKWVPELRDIKGGKGKGAIHEPYERGAAAICQKTRYPRKIIERKDIGARMIARYKEGLGRSTA